nr:unnamed protein product [Callosobruchus analis]
MRPNRLERHLKQQHPILVLTAKEFFSSKAESLKRMRLDKSGSYHTTSFEIAFMIAKQKKPHTIGEKLITPCVLKVDIKSQLINKLKLSPCFAISCDESSDIVNCAQLMFMLVTSVEISLNTFNL